MCLAACENLTSIELAVCKDFATEVVMTCQIMIWEQAQAGDRAGKTRRRFQRLDSEMECDVSTTAGRPAYHSAFRLVCNALSLDVTAILAPIATCSHETVSQLSTLLVP